MIYYEIFKNTTLYCSVEIFTCVPYAMSSIFLLNGLLKGMLVLIAQILQQSSSIIRMDTSCFT